MLCARIITFSLLTISLGWSTTSWAQSGRPTTHQSGTSLAERLASLRNAFRKDDSNNTRFAPSRSNRQSSNSGNSRSSSRSANEKTARNSDSARAKTANTRFPRIQVGDFMPDGLFSHGNRSTQTKLNRQPAISQNSARIPAGPSQRVNPERGSVRIARSSPDLGSRQDELESALSELMDPRLNIEIDPANIVPPQTDSSEQIPGFLSDAQETDDPKSGLDHRTVSQAITPTQKKKSIVQNKSLDLRNALLGSVAEDELTSQVTNTSMSQDRLTTKPVFTPPAEGPRFDEVEVTGDNDRATKITTTTNSNTSERFQRDEATTDNALRPDQDAFSEEDFTTNRDGANRIGENRAGENRDGDADAEGMSANSGDDGIVFADDFSEGESLLFSYQQPVIVSHVEGPRKVLVGREAKFRVVLRNRSDTIAESLAATIHIPAWVEVVDATSSQGIIQRADAEGTEGIDGNTLQWRMQRLEARGSQTLDLRLVPNSGRALQLGVSWTHAPVGSETVVEVQEPKLLLSIGGPSDVLFGKPQRYRLSLSNPGTGVAEHVMIKLLPPGGDASSITNQRVGALQPGATKVIDLELTAREAGELQIKATAIAAGDLQTSTVKQVFCSKPELEIDWRGPESKYAGTVSTYYFRVRNPGTAATEPLEIKLQLPAGVGYVASSEGELFDADQNTVSWQIAGLSPDEEQFMKVQCRLEKPGLQAMRLSAQTATGDLRDKKMVETNVVALADLKLNVSDPKGPVPVGELATYEIRVLNRGTNAAEGVNIVALFSEGIDPISVEGAQYEIRDGRVSFRAIKSLPAGRDVVLKIRAKATQPGMHIFRTEVVCQDLDSKLSAEESTRFFKDDFRWTEGDTPYSAEPELQSTSTSE